jgi:outer membrane protein assembly factor BamB
MGFLMRHSGHPTTIFAHFLLTTLLVALLPGCSGLRLPYPLRSDDSDVSTFAGNSARNNNAATSPSPPLTLHWEQGITAGVGEGGPLLVDSILIVGNLRGELYAFDVRTGKRHGWVTLGGAIHGSPVIEENIAFVPLAGSAESLIAYDLLEGRIRWRQNLGDLHTSPLLMDARLYAGNTAGVFHCVMSQDGLPAWTYALPDNSTMKGIRSSPAGVDHSVLFGADDGYLYHLDATTGALRWRFNAGSAIQATPVLYQDRVYVGTLAGKLVAVNTATGKEEWTCALKGSMYGPALVDSSLVIVGTTAGFITALNRMSGTTVWTTEIHAPVNSGVLGVGEYAYAGTLRKDLIALRRMTGEIVWRTTLDGRVKTTPVAGAGYIYVAQDNRTIQAFREERK